MGSSLLVSSWVAAALVAVGCNRSTELGEASTSPGQAPIAADGAVSRPPKPSAAAPAAEAGTVLAEGPAAVPSAPIPALDPSPYAWLADTTVESLPAVDHLEQRIKPPRGFERVPLQGESFGHWLRRLPLAAAGTPVRKFNGGLLLQADHENLAAVAAVDSGKADLQQCADSVIRMHAEWMWSRGRRDMSYRAAAGTPLPYERWARGDRVVQKGMSIEWVPSSRPSAGDHGSFRKFLDTVFAWANTVSLERQAKKVTVDDLRPGDFVILPGNPGHTVIFLDLAKDKDGRRVALLGQGYMPAQGFYVLRPTQGQTWFDVDAAAGAIETPFWAPFPWTSLRRLDD